MICEYCGKELKRWGRHCPPSCIGKAERAKLLAVFDACAPIIPTENNFPIKAWKSTKEGVITGTWAEDFNPYEIHAPPQLAHAICELQQALPLIAKKLDIKLGKKKKGGG